MSDLLRTFLEFSPNLIRVGDRTGFTTKSGFGFVASESEVKPGDRLTVGKREKAVLYSNELGLVGLYFQSGRAKEVEFSSGSSTEGIEGISIRHKKVKGKRKFKPSWARARVFESKVHLEYSVKPATA